MENQVNQVNELLKIENQEKIVNYLKSRGIEFSSADPMNVVIAISIMCTNPGIVLAETKLDWQDIYMIRETSGNGHLNMIELAWESAVKESLDMGNDLETIEGLKPAYEKEWKKSFTIA